MGIVDLALGFIADYGLIAIFVLLVLDSALLLPVFPGEIVLIMAMAAYVQDMSGLIMLITLATAAAMVGSLLLYGIMRGGGSKLLERFPWLFMMPKKRRERFERQFQKVSGQSLVLFLRFIPLTRIIINIPAGLAKMPVVRFIVLSTIGMAGYHIAFLYFTYEANRPGSTIATQREQLEEAYASPAWEFMQTNQIITGLVLLALGVLVALRSAWQMHRDPEESTGSLVGFATTSILIWGGAALAVAVYMEPLTVYALVALGGLDLLSIAQAIGAPRPMILWAACGVSIFMGFMLSRVRGIAKAKKKRYAQLARFQVYRQQDDRLVHGMALAEKRRKK